MRSLLSVLTTVSLLAATVTLLLLQLPTADAVCSLTNEPGQKLPYYNDSNGIPSCRRGYYCPDFDASNTSTYPEACLADAVCQVKRLWGETCDTSQGTYEPRVCPAGFYCPYNEGTIIKCADDVLCGIGSTEPETCPALSFCNGEKAQNFGLLVYWLVMSVALIFIYVIYGRVGLTSTLTETTDENGLTPTPGGNTREVSWSPDSAAPVATARPSASSSPTSPSLSRTPPPARPSTSSRTCPAPWSPAP
jgi:hypothetical protein